MGLVVGYVIGEKRGRAGLGLALGLIAMFLLTSCSSSNDSTISGPSSPSPVEPHTAKDAYSLIRKANLECFNPVITRIDADQTMLDCHNASGRSNVSLFVNQKSIKTDVSLNMMSKEWCPAYFKDGYPLNENNPGINLVGYTWSAGFGTATIPVEEQLATAKAFQSALGGRLWNSNTDCA